MNLEVLHLHNPRQPTNATSGSMSSPLCLPRLHDLLLIDKHPDFSLFRTLIDCLNLPALEAVGISSDRDLEPLRRCVMRSSPNGVARLRSVEVRCSQGLGQTLDLQELSLAAPQIQELRIIDPSTETLFAMEFRSTNPPLFPHLQYLTLIDPFLRGFELVDIINSRCHPPPSSDLEPYTRLRRVEVMVTMGRTTITQAIRRYGMVQPFHEEFQDVAECFTDDPNFKQMCERLKSILTFRESIPSSIERYQLPSHWGRSIDPLLCFFEFSDSVFTFFENYEVYHPLLLSRYPVAPLLQEFLNGNIGPDSLLRTHQKGFLNRARILLDEWQPIIAEYNKKERWIIEKVGKTYSLVRKAGESVYKVVYCITE
ncbi:hypothetical protein BD779DRAFT_1551193 [Infundibulicybe gibba]|nr:hypothetical protein BD779DRAFT_1551193 [Infundibulicybe gibba]